MSGFQIVGLFLLLSLLGVPLAVSMGLSRKDARQRAFEVLEEIGIARWAEMLAGGLPYGLERRVEVAAPELGDATHGLLLGGDDRLAGRRLLPGGARLGLVGGRQRRACSPDRRS